MKIPRAVRNKNPGNIERNDIRWLGMSDDQRNDDRYVVFDSVVYGVRAMAKVLLTYQSEYHLKTVRAMIERYAPPSENDTESYSRHVAAHMGVGVTQTVQLKDESERLYLMVEAMISVESGNYQPLSEAIIFEGIDMALEVQ